MDEIRQKNINKLKHVINMLKAIFFIVTMSKHAICCEIKIIILVWVFNSGLSGNYIL